MQFCASRSDLIRNVMVWPDPDPGLLINFLVISNWNEGSVHRWQYCYFVRKALSLAPFFLWTLRKILLGTQLVEIWLIRVLDPDSHCPVLFQSSYLWFAMATKLGCGVAYRLARRKVGPCSIPIVQSTLGSAGERGVIIFVLYCEESHQFLKKLTESYPFFFFSFKVNLLKLWWYKVNFRISSK